MLLLAACEQSNDGNVAEVYGTYVVCISPASGPFQVAIDTNTAVEVGDACPSGTSR